jgi:hypothetical protein
MNRHRFICIVVKKTTLTTITKVQKKFFDVNWLCYNSVFLKSAVAMVTYLHKAQSIDSFCWEQIPYQHGSAEYHLLKTVLPVEVFVCRFFVSWFYNNYFLAWYKTLITGSLPVTAEMSHSQHTLFRYPTMKNIFYEKDAQETLWCRPLSIVMFSIIACESKKRWRHAEAVLTA